MFGYLPAPCRCQIGSRIDLYRSTFCGLCNALAGQYGQPARFLTNRDSTFVAMLAAAQASEPPAATLSTRCQPWRRPLPVFEAGPIPAFAAAVTLCGFQAKLIDERADERGLRALGGRLLASLSRPRFDRAQATLAAGGFPVATTVASATAAIASTVVTGEPTAAAATATGVIVGTVTVTGAIATIAIAATVIAVAATVATEAGYPQSLSSRHRAGVNFDLC